MCIFGALGQWAQGDTAAKVGEYNQSLLNAQAVRRRQVGNIEATQFLRRASQMMGDYWVQFATGGARLDEGSPADVAAKTYDEINYDAQLIRWNAEAEAVELENQGRMARYTGEARQRAGTIAGYGSLLSDSLQMYSMFAPRDSGGSRPSGSSAKKTSSAQFMTGWKFNK